MGNRRRHYRKDGQDGAGTQRQIRDTETELRDKEASVGACVTVPLDTHTHIASIHLLGVKSGRIDKEQGIGCA